MCWLIRGLTTSNQREGNMFLLHEQWRWWWRACGKPCHHAVRRPGSNQTGVSVILSLSHQTVRGLHFRYSTSAVPTISWLHYNNVNSSLCGATAKEVKDQKKEQKLPRREERQVRETLEETRREEIFIDGSAHIAVFKMLFYFFISTSSPLAFCLHWFFSLCQLSGAHVLIDRIFFKSHFGSCGNTVNESTRMSWWCLKQNWELKTPNIVF